MAEYGFTSADISSISSARNALTAGFMQLGKQVQEDIERIALNREMKAFGQEMAQLDPTQDAFPQQLITTLSKYPLASRTPLAQKGIDVLGMRYKASLDAKKATQPWMDLGGGMYNVPDVGTFEYDESGKPKFVDPTPQTSSSAVRGTVIQTPEGQTLINPTTGETIREFSPRPSSTRSTNLNVLPENVKMQIRFMDEDAKAVQTERQKLVDAITNGTIPSKDRPAAIERQKQLETQLQNIKDTRNKILSEAAAAQSERMGLPSGAGQGMGGPSLMPGPAQPQNSFVPMPNTVPTPQQMTRNEEGGAVTPDQLPVLPNTTTVKEASAASKRLYEKRGGKIAFPRTNYREAVEQAFNDRIISEQRRNELLQNSP